MNKVALDPIMWAIAWAHGPKHAYVGPLLCMQLEFQKHKKCKLSAIMVEVWNESNIIWEQFQTSFFPLYKALHGTFSKHTNATKKKEHPHRK